MLPQRSNLGIVLHISDYRELKYFYENAMGRGKQYKPYDYELTMAPHVRKTRGTVIRALSLWDKR